MGRYDFLTAAGIPWRADEPLSQHASFRIGGPAACAVFPRNRSEFCSAIDLLKEEDPLILGRGTNVLFPDEPFLRPVVFTEGLQEIRRGGNTLTAEAGVPLSLLCGAARAAGLSGLEFAFGIPGSVGGGIYMNAGAFGGFLGDLCTRVVWYDREAKKVCEHSGEEATFAYRSSFYSAHKNAVVLVADFTLSAGEPEAIAEEMRAILARRREAQPLEYPSAGSVFKRPVGAYAAKLIDECGLRGLSVGGAQVSEKHAGFIVNRGGATSHDVRELIERVRAIVCEKTGVLLECEIELL